MSEPNPTLSQLSGTRKSCTTLAYLQDTLGSPTMQRSEWITRTLYQRRTEYLSRSKIQVFVATWNLAAKTPTVPLDQLLEASASASIIAVGFQEALPLSAQKTILGTLASPGSVSSSDRESESVCSGSAGGSASTDAASDNYESVQSTESILSQSTTSLSQSNNDFGPSSSRTMAALADAVLSATGPNKRDFRVLATRQLVGLSLVVLAHDSVFDDISCVESGSVGCGVLGLMGNKGAVAVRLRLRESEICFLNSHLASDMENLSRRNADFQVICRRLDFKTLHSGKRSQHDSTTLFSQDYRSVVFWFGDLNYRIECSRHEIFASLSRGELKNILLNDQLISSMRRQRAFEDYKEHHIDFAPTYKYDIGTSDWDTSEKQRIPAWCDRILWRPGANNQDVVCLEYRSHSEYTHSDHKPVTALFEVAIDAVDEERHRLVLRDICRQHDKIANSSIPTISLSALNVNFGDVHFLQSKSTEITLENTGNMMALWLFASKADSGMVASSWTWPHPLSGALRQQEKKSVIVNLHIDLESISTFAKAEAYVDGKIAISEILVLRVECGSDLYISVDANVYATCFGRRISHLCAMSTCARLFNSAGFDPEVRLHSVPEEIVLLTSYLSDNLNSSDVYDHLTRPVLDFDGIEKMLLVVINALDFRKGFEFPENSSPSERLCAVAGAFRIFLQSLPEPVVPAHCLESFAAASSIDLFMEAMTTLPQSHRGVLLAVLEVCFKAIAKYCAGRKKRSKLDEAIKKERKVICNIFVPLLFRVTKETQSAKFRQLRAGLINILEPGVLFQS